MKSPSFERLNVSFHTRENLVGGGPFTSFSFTAHRKTIPRSDVRINKHEERSLRGKERKHPGEVTSLSFGRLTDSPTVNPYSAGSSSTGGCRASRPNGSSVAMEWPFTWEIGCAGARRRKKKKKNSPPILFSAPRSRSRIFFLSTRRARVHHATTRDTRYTRIAGRVTPNSA